MTAVNANDCPNGLYDLGGKKVIGGPILREAGSHEARYADKIAPAASTQTRVDAAKEAQPRGKDNQKLRQRDPYVARRRLAARDSSARPEGRSG